MELSLENVGIIKNSSIQLDGLTVITGKNESGKTTAGKALYSLIRANSNVDDAFEHAKIAYIISQVTKIWIALTAMHGSYYRTIELDESETPEMHILAALSRRYSPRSTTLDSMMSLLVEARDVLASLEVSSLITFLTKYRPYLSAPTRNEQYIRTIAEQFESRRSDALNICDSAIHTIDAPSAYTSFLTDRTKQFLNLSFRGQITPVRNPDAVTGIKLSDDTSLIFDLRIRNKSDFEYLDDSSFVNPFNQAIFLDDPFVLDKLDSDDYYLSGFHRRDDDSITSIDVFPYDDYLKQLLGSEESLSFFDELEFNRTYKPLFEMINSIVPGEFLQSSDGTYYVNDGVKLHVQNLATGSKLFFIIKLLLMKGYLTSKTVLILDEPESHLHPEWINKFAEILVLLIKEIRVNVLLTTHSPNLLLALNVYSQQYSLMGKAHFYLAHKDADSWTTSLDCIDDNIGDGYSHLSLPLIEMHLQQDDMTGG